MATTAVQGQAYHTPTPQRKSDLTLIGVWKTVCSVRCYEAAMRERQWWQLQGLEENERMPWEFHNPQTIHRIPCTECAIPITANRCFMCHEPL